MDLDEQERTQLSGILGCTDVELDARIEKFSKAATEEYLRMVLGQKVFTRGQDIHEYRLFLLILHVFEGDLPTDQQISSYFQTTTAQSRSLLRAVLSKYQYQLQTQVEKTFKKHLQGAFKESESGYYTVTINSETVVEALNRRLAIIDGTMPLITKERGTVSSFVIQESAFNALNRFVSRNSEQEDGDSEA